MKIKLTKSQKTKIIEIWNAKLENPPSIEELIIEIFGIESDGRSEEGIAIREFLAEKSAGVIKLKEKKIVELTGEQKLYVENNHDKMTATEMARILFSNNTLMTGHPETRAIIGYKNSLNPAVTYANEKVLKEFNPPRSEEQVIKLVNKFVLNAFNPEKITGAVKKCLSSCVAYFNNERFLGDIERYQDANERKTFISCFVRHVFDKPDLTQHDVDIIILFSKEVIEEMRQEDQMNFLRQRQDELGDNPDAKISMSLVEMINNCTNNLTKSKKVQSDLLKEINEKRADRLKKEAANHNSLLNLTAEWKEQEGREQLLKIADMRKKAVGDKFDELDQMDAYLARIIGVTKDEVLYGM